MSSQGGRGAHAANFRRKGKESCGFASCVLQVIQSTKRHLGLAAYLGEFHAAEKREFQESLFACKNAKQELIRLAAEQLNDHASLTTSYAHICLG